MTGKYYEDFAEGEKFITPGRTITETDLVNFMTLAVLTAPLFINREYWEKESIFKGRVSPGPFIIGVSLGLDHQLAIRRDTGMAFLGIDEVRMPAPVRWVILYMSKSRWCGSGKAVSLTEASSRSNGS